MKPICSDLQERLAEEGAQALRSDAAAQRHLEECPDCFRVLEQLARLDAAFAAMPAHDAADRVVADLLGRVKVDAVPLRHAAPEPFAPPPSGGRPWVWAIGAAATVVVVGTLFTTSLMRAPDLPEPARANAERALMLEGNKGLLPKPTSAPPTTIVPPSASADDKVAAELHMNRQASGNAQLTKEEFESLRALGYIAEPQPGQRGRDLVAPKPELQSSPASPAQGRHASGLESDAKASPAPVKKPASRDGEVSTKTGTLNERLGVEGGMVGGVPGGVVGGVVGSVGGKAVEPLRVGGAIKEPKRIRGGEAPLPPLARQAGVQGVVVLEIVIGPTGKVTNARILRSVPALDAQAVQTVMQWVYEPTIVDGRAVPVVMTVTVSFRLAETPKPEPDLPQGAADAAAAFLEERSSTEAVFQPARGYWSNTYLPGDPALRLLRARLRGSHVRLHEAAAPTLQPFDAPAQSGLALYVSADRRALDKPSRMLLQVGLKGAPRSAGHRPPMSVALVFDLRGERAAETVADMRALALAFAEAREAGDRFSLVVAGPNGVMVPHDKFRHGPVAVAFERLMMTTADGSGLALDLPGAVASALLQAGQCEDPDAALGGSAVVLVTAQPLGDAVAAVEDLAHQGAVAGIPTSVVSVGSGASPAELDRIALAGQGSRRSLETRADAPRLAEAEPVAASDVVARAVRLRIRLSPRVRLVEVVGSRRLDEAQAQRVREAERSVDLRLSRLLGIEKDRGEDEDGIQIVIPSFHAGDDHVILLDVVAEGPGALADVSVRYKDVAFLRNGAARANLDLPGGQTAAGPIERNVLKNLLAIRLAQGFAEAGAALDAGDAALASALVGRASALRSGLLARIAGLAGDRELSRDVALLQEYSRALAGGGAASRELADSLRYAGRLKLLSRSAAGAGIL